MRIIKLQSANVKRLKAVEITPDGSLVIIGGPNCSGKTSGLDSVAYALAGKRAIPAEPIRRGAKSAEIVVDLDDLVVKRRFTDKGTYLEVVGKDGGKFASPQQILDKLVGALTFDPLAFSRMNPPDQLETLKKLVGLDFSALDRRREIAYDERRDLNRELKAAEARLSEMPFHEGAPPEEVSVAALVEDLKRREETNRQNERKRNELRQASREAENLAAQIGEIHQQIAELQAKEKALLKKKDEVVAAGRKLVAEVEGLQDADTESVVAEINGAEKANRMCRENAAYLALEGEILKLRKASQARSDAILEIAAEKAKAVADANLPIPGLGLGEDGVTLNGLPLEQASGAEQLRASVAIGIALNPRLRVLLVRDASLLDENSLRLVAEMAKAADAQVWLECVNPNDPSAVILEDGAVKGAEPVAVAAEEGNGHHE